MGGALGFISFWSLTAIAVTVVESSPPERMHPIGLSDMNLFLTAYVRLSSICLQKAK